MRIIDHISDLHFCAAEARGHYWNTEATELAVLPHNRRGLLGSLLYDLRNENLAPDLVVVSGDLLDRGNETGVEPVVSRMESMMSDFFVRLVAFRPKALAIRPGAASSRAPSATLNAPSAWVQKNGPKRRDFSRAN